MKRVFVLMELTDGQYDVLQRLSGIEKKDHSIYTQEALLELMEADLSLYFAGDNPERQELVDKVGLEAIRQKKLAQKEQSKE
jgi:hypothetical protein